MRPWPWSAEDGGLSRAVTAETGWTGGARATQDGASVGTDGRRRRGSSCERSPALPATSWMGVQVPRRQAMGEVARSRSPQCCV